MSETQKPAADKSWTPVVVVGGLMLALLVAACWMSGALEWLLDIDVVVIDVD